jgi:glycosyltransferase involved in cell wall biosynthesis
VIGRLTPWKGQHVLVQAFARIANQFPRARVMIIGTPIFENDTYAKELSAETGRLGLAERVTFAGFRWDLPQVLNALDIVIHTALEKDSSPLAVVSAMAAGRPIICTRVEGTAELLHDGIDALLIRPGDAGELADKLSLLLSDPDLRRRLGQAARIRAERELSIEVFTQRCTEVFDRAIRNP